MEYKGLFGFDDDDEGGGCDEKVSRKRVRSVSEVEEEEDDEDKNGVEVSDMFVCSGEGCYQKVIHVGVVEDENKRCLPYVLPCPLYVRADKYSRFVNGRMESYDVKSLLERLNKALYVDGGTRFSEWRRYVVTDMLLGNGDNAVFLAEMLMKVLSGVLIVDMVDVDVDTMVGELRLNMEKIVSGLGDNGATNLSSINFTVDDMDKLKADARKEAISKAKIKAEQLAKDLGVELVRIISFNEGGDYPVMNYARADMMSVKAEGAGAAPTVLPVGQNKMVSNITITYEIR
jgi:hypothetical protein